MLYQILFLVLLLFIILIVFYKLIIRNIFDYLYISKYENYINMVNYFCESSYESIYKQYIIPFSSEGYKIDSQRFETIQRSYTKITLDLMGNRNKNILINYFGNYEYLINYLISYIENRLEKDDLLNFMKEKQNNQKGNL